MYECECYGGASITFKICWAELFFYCFRNGDDMMCSVRIQIMADVVEARHDDIEIQIFVTF